MRRSAAAAAAALLAAFSAAATQARAWEYARWGLTPDELLSASAGAARTMREAEPRNEGRVIARLESDGRFEAIAMAIEFRFDAATDRLAEIRLRPENFADCPRLLERLYARYGAAAFSTRHGSIGAAVWNVPSEPMRASYTEAEGLRERFCSLVLAEAR